MVKIKRCTLLMFTVISLMSFLIANPLTIQAESNESVSILNDTNETAKIQLFCTDKPDDDGIDLQTYYLIKAKIKLVSGEKKSFPGTGTDNLFPGTDYKFDADTEEIDRIIGQFEGGTKFDLTIRPELYGQTLSLKDILAKKYK